MAQQPPESPVSPTPQGTPASETLARILAEEGVMAEDELRELIQKHPHDYLGDILVRGGILLERYIHSILARVLQVPCVSVDCCTVDPCLLNLVTEGFCREHRVFPVCQVRRFLTLATVNPLDTAALERAQEVTGLIVRPVLCSRRQLARTLDALRDDAS
jgi:hypothetical protein